MVVAALTTRRGSIELDGRTRVMGILNLTPDSFSDGGRFENAESAVEAALRLEEEGADIIDIGGYSSRPGAADVSEDEELSRVLPVVEALASRLRVPISIDTFRARVFRRAWEAGAEILNDITALDGDEAMIDELAETGAPAVLMHMQGTPQSMQAAPHYDDVVEEICAYFRDKLALLDQRGITSDRVVLDPGIGFGKTLEHNLQILRSVDDFGSLGCALLFGTSRKSFLGKILDRPDPAERQWGTAATSAHLSSSGVHILRVHDVRAAVDVITVMQHLTRREPV